MTVKLSLSVPENTAVAIKKYARRKKTSVSKIAEQLFEKTLQEDTRRIQVRKFIEQTAGIVKHLDVPDLKEAIAQAIEEKHGEKNLS